jgi:hypothetical protein
VTLDDLVSFPLLQPPPEPPCTVHQEHPKPPGSPCPPIPPR